MSNTATIEPEHFMPVEAEWNDPERFVITSKGQADWAVRKLKQCRERIAANHELYEAEVAGLMQWLSAANREDVRSAEYFEAILRNWHMEQLDAQDEAWEKKKDKTLPLPGGKLAARKTPVNVDIDEEVFTPWALETHPELIETKHQPKRNDIKKHIVNGRVLINDEIVPGVTVVEGELKWEAKV